MNALGLVRSTKQTMANEEEQVWTRFVDNKGEKGELTWLANYPRAPRENRHVDRQLKTISYRPELADPHMGNKSIGNAPLESSVGKTNTSTRHKPNPHPPTISIMRRWGDRKVHQQLCIRDQGSPAIATGR